MVVFVQHFHTPGVPLSCVRKYRFVAFNSSPGMRERERDGERMSECKKDSWALLVLLLLQSIHCAT
jgi:hypothetical protein